MKLRVNLYQAGLQPIKVAASLPLLLRLIGIVLMSLLASWGWLQQQSSVLQQQVSTLQQQQQSQLQQLENLQQALAQRQPSVGLTEQAQHLQQSIRQKQQLLAHLTQQQSEQAPSFAAILQHLALIDPKGFWLTEFQLGADVRFKGVVQQSQQLPDWLTALGKHPHLQGLTMQHLQVQPLPNTTWLQFDMSTVSVESSVTSSASSQTPLFTTPVATVGQGS